jgi:hypothetical protein
MVVRSDHSMPPQNCSSGFGSGAADSQRMGCGGRHLVNNKFHFFNCACAKLIRTHKGLNRPGATIPAGYPTPTRPCKYCSKRCVSVSILFSASSRYSFANAAQHCRLLCCKAASSECLSPHLHVYLLLSLWHKH